MTFDDYLAERVTKCVVAKLDINTFTSMGDDLFEFVKETASNEALTVSAEAAGTDIWKFSNNVNHNITFNKIAISIHDSIVSDEVINSVVASVKSIFKYNQ